MQPSAQALYSHTEIMPSLVEAAPASLLVIHRNTVYDLIHLANFLTIRKWQGEALINLVHLSTISDLRF